MGWIANRRVGAGLAAVGAGVVLMGFVGASRGEAKTAGYCTPFTGPKWTLTGAYALPGPATRRTGAQYLLLVRGVPCTTALGAARKLAGSRLSRRTPKVDIPMTGGPAGFSCKGRSDSNGRAYTGGCFMNKNQVYFIWTVKLV